MTEAPDTRYEREFGKGTFIGDSSDNFLIKPIEQQVYEMGWSHGCPVVDEVVKKFGPEWTLKRYAECNFVFGLVIEAAKDLNPKLHKMLTTSLPRLKNEKPNEGHYNLKLVPESFSKEMHPLTTPWGYAIPRVIIEEMGRGNNNSDRTQVRILKALNLIDKSVKASKTPSELLIKLAESVSTLDANPKSVLAHTLSADFLNEEGCKSIMDDLKSRIDKSAPNLRKIYNSMSESERINQGIINF